MGTSAKQQATTNVKNTISCFKRLIGRQYQDPQVQDEIKNFPKPYAIVEGKSGEALIQVSPMIQCLYLPFLPPNTGSIPNHRMLPFFTPMLAWRVIMNS